MIRALTLAVVLMTLTGCAAVAGYAGQHPGRIACKGKGVLAFQGGPYAGTIQGDCGDGFSYEQGPPSGNTSVIAPPK